MLNMRSAVVAVCIAFTQNLAADDSTLEAAVGGGIGGAVGAAIGSELGGRDGAIIGAGVGAAAGAAIATDGTGHDHAHEAPPAVAVPAAPRAAGTFCPPGQAKKGRC